jgi:hypothetical protein
VKGRYPIVFIGKLHVFIYISCFMYV